jgi:hypothetical protein
MKKCEMDRVCGTHRKEIKMGIWREKSDRSLDHFEEFGVGGKIILKLISNRA